MAGVLIVEDEIFVALDIEHILISAGFEVVGIAQDRKSAMALAIDCNVALIDVNLHDGATGPSIGMDIAARHGAEIIFVTSHPFLVGEAAQIASGVISKPFRPDMIIDTVRRALDGGRGVEARNEDPAFLSQSESSSGNQLQS